MSQARKKEAQDLYGVMVNKNTIRFERLLPGPAERLWAYLTESGKRAQWLAAGPMELRIGGKVTLQFDNSNLTRHGEATPEQYREIEGEGMRGKILRCDPPHVLSYSWIWGDEKTEVTFELAPRGKDVLLTITHKNIADRDMLLSVAAGWHTHAGILLSKLKGEEPESFWPTHERLVEEYERLIG